MKFRQMYRGIPVYGSIVTVELDENNQLLALNSSLAEPTIDPVAEVSVKDAIAKIWELAGYGPSDRFDVVPWLAYYYEPRTGDDHGWNLVYVAEDVVKAPTLLCRNPTGWRGA